MIQSGQSLYNGVLMHNWRVQPAQFGLPLPSHVLAELVRAAGFDAISYKSTMGPGRCLAEFPDQLSGQTYVELVDKAPPGARQTRSDDDSADSLAGWNIIPPSFGGVDLSPTDAYSTCIGVRLWPTRTSKFPATLNPRPHLVRKQFGPIHTDFTRNSGNPLGY